MIRATSKAAYREIDQSRRETVYSVIKRRLNCLTGRVTELLSEKRIIEPGAGRRAWLAYQLRDGPRDGAY